MRILIVVDCYYPRSKSSAKLIHDLGIELLLRGNEVVVVTPSDSIKNSLELSEEEGLLIARIRTGKIKEVPNIVRAWREARLSSSLWRKGKPFFQGQSFGLIIFYSPSIFFGPLVHKLKLLWKCPAYLILRDIFPQWAVDAGVLQKGWAYRFFRQKELDQYAAADIIGVQSPANLEYFGKELPGRHYHLEVLYNWTTLHEPETVFSDYRSQFGLQGKVVFFYGGNMGKAQDMDNIIRLACNLRNEPNVHLLLVGDGSEWGRLKASARERKLANLSIFAGVGQQEYLAMLSEFDVGLVSLDRRLQTQNFPGKILGYMYSSLPILASINPGNDLRDLLEKSKAGFCCLNGDDETFHRHALTLAQNAGLRKRMGHNSRRLLEQTFSVGSASKQILAHFQRSSTPQFTQEAVVGISQ